jgi:hypothetical protein
VKGTAREIDHLALRRIERAFGPVTIDKFSLLLTRCRRGTF